MGSNRPCEIKRVVIEVTEDCNNACMHCYNYWRDKRAAVGSPEELSRTGIRDLIRKVKRDAPLSQVALSGGEPMLREDLPDIVGDLMDEGLSSVIITNGTLLSESRLRRFPEGSIFETTLFSADARLHNRIAGRPVFNQVIEGMVRILKYRCKSTLACVVTKLNAHDVTRTIKLAIALGVDAVLFNRINLSSHVLPIAERLVPSATMLRESLDAADEAARKYGVMIAVSVPIPPCVVDPRKYSHLHFGWCPRGNKDSYYTIGSTGLLRPCNHSSVILGDLHTHRFRDIVLGQKAKAFWAPVPKECLACAHPLMDLCRGGCPAAADECYNTRDRMDPFVGFANKNMRF